ncbi:MAG: hypothetical protein IPJ68_03240 [Candidatus Moraniibacteriota bacterium]|nr:MAG: hypothetical protein IPJ68_03240 [Candidatus Moranbacteria bacterium]
MTTAFLISHGKRYEGFNPLHTKDGREQLARLTIPSGVTRVVAGSGRRFQEIADAIRRKLPIASDVPFETSPFCGSCDGIRFGKNPGEGDMIVLSEGEVPVEKYLGLVGTPGFDPWAFVNGLGNGALLCGGGELLLALGYSGVPPKGALFGLDALTKEITLLQQG